MTSDLSTLFAQYAQHGDPRALAEVFDRTSSDLLRLALHLTKCEPDAEDLLQATFLTAIQVAGKFDSKRELLPWLCGILVNHARHLARRSLYLKAKATDIVAEDPADRVAATETSKALREAIERLHPLYREPIQMRLLEGMSTLAIANDLDRSPGTVRVQIHRGLEQLRRMLPRSFALSGAVMLIHGQGVAAVRRAVLDRAIDHAGTCTGGLAWLLLFKKSMLVVAASAAAIALWLLWPNEDLSSDVLDLNHRISTETRTADEVVDNNEVDQHDGVVEILLRTARDAVTRADARLRGSLSVALRWQSDGLPAQGVLVHLDLQDGRDPLFHSAELRSNVDGLVVFENLVPGTVRVIVDRGMTSSVAIEAGKQSSLKMKLPTGLDVVGVVVDESGHPVAGAKLFHGHRTDPANSVASVLQHVTVSDNAGRFYLRGVRMGGSLAARAPGRAPSTLHYLSGAVPADGKLKVVLTLRGPGFDLGGRVVDGSGQPVPAAMVSISRGPPSNPRRLPDGSFVQLWQTYYLRTDNDGRFRAEGVLPGENTLRIRSESHSPYVKHVFVSDGLVREQSYVLEPGGLITGVVRDERGRPLTGASVLLSNRLWRITVSTELMRTGRDGRYMLGGLKPGPMSISAHCRGYQPQTKVLVVGSDQPRRWDPILVMLPRISGKVVGQDNVGIPEVHVEAIPAKSRTYSERWSENHVYVDVTDAQGSFEIPVDGSQAYKLSLGEKGSLVLHRCDSLGMIRGGERQITVTLRDSHRATASVKGRARDYTGTPLGNSPVSIERRTLGGPLPLVLESITGAAKEQRGYLRSVGHTHPETGEFELGLLPPGRYWFRFVGHGTAQQPFTVGPVDLHPHAVVDLGEVHAGPGGDLLLSCRSKKGASITEVSAFLSPLAGGRPILLSCIPKKQIRHRLAVGRYKLRAWGPGLLTISGYDVSVEQDKTTTVQLEFEPGTCRGLLFPVPTPKDWDPGEHVNVVLRSAGKVIAETSLPVKKGSPIGYATSLRKGHYRLEVETGGKRFEGGFEIANVHDLRPLRVALSPIHR